MFGNRIFIYLFGIISSGLICQSFANNTFDFISKLTASDGASNDYFGWSVDVSDDGYAIVGAYGDDSNTGSVYIYEYDSINNIWIEDAILSHPNASLFDYFGRSVSISGTYAIVGAYRDDITNEDEGSAFIYERDSATGTWDLVATLVHPDPATDDEFGNSVSISGNFAIVGVSNDDDNGGESGSAFIYERDSATGTWNQVSKLSASDGSQDDLFGISVSITSTSNINNDNSEVVQVYAIVGSHQQDDVASNAGAAYIFERDSNTGTFDQTAKLTASDGATSDFFGASVSISLDDTTGEMNAYAMIGAYGDDDYGSSSGSVYIFERDNNGNWDQISKLVSSDGEASDRCGYSVSIFNNVAIYGCYRDDDLGSNSGSAYVYGKSVVVNGTSSTSIWSLSSKVTADDGAASDQFGISVALSSNFGIIGSLFDDDKGTDSGSVYTYSVDFDYPSLNPTNIPSFYPSDIPSSVPTNFPTNYPSSEPSAVSTTGNIGNGDGTDIMNTSAVVESTGNDSGESVDPTAPTDGNSAQTYVANSKYLQRLTILLYGLYFLGYFIV